jgi:hypothetical protein
MAVLELVERDINKSVARLGFDLVRSYLRYYISSITPISTSLLVTLVFNKPTPECI